MNSACSFTCMKSTVSTGLCLLLGLTILMVPLQNTLQSVRNLRLQSLKLKVKALPRARNFYRSQNLLKGPMMGAGKGEIPGEHNRHFSLFQWRPSQI